MSVRKCLLGKVESGILTKEQMVEIEDRLNRYEQKNRRGMNEEQAEALAAKQAAESFASDKARKARQTKLRMARQAELEFGRQQYQGSGYDYLLSELDVDRFGRNTSAPVANLQEMHRNRAYAMMNDLLATYRPRVAGILRPRAGIEDVVRELHGQNTGLDTAKELAEGFRAASKYLWNEFNRSAGDTIAWREDWALPHIHDPVKVGSVTADQWADEIIPLLNRDKMLDFDTQQPLSDAELRGLLLEVHDNIRTHGMNDKTPGAVGGRSTGNRRSDPRMLQFKDGDAWLEYSGKYGDGDPLGTMFGYVESMARDIGMMEKFGPNPKAMIQTMKDVVAIEDARKGPPKGMKQYVGQQYQNTLASWVDATYAQLAGSNSIPVNGFFSGISNTIRSTLSGVLLQGSTLSAVTDLNGQRIAYRMMGYGPLSATIKSIPNLVRNFAASMPDTQQLALHLGAGADSWSQMATGAARYVGDTAGPDWSRRFVDTTMRAIGLTPWTQGGKNVLALDFYHLLQQHSGKGFDALPKELRDEFSRFGIGSDYWDKIRAADPLVARNGAKYVNPMNVFNADREAGTRLQNMQLTLSRTAIIEASPLMKAAALGQSKPGTLGGEVARNTLLFKSFPLTQLHMQLMNAVNSRQGGFSKVGMAANVVIGATVFGAVATQMKEMNNGRDPLGMDPSTSEGRKFWGKALMQGGGLSLFGDFMFSDQNAFGKGPWTSFGGPVVDLLDDITRVTAGNVWEAAQGKETNVGREATDLLKKYMPVGKHWYWKLGFERNVLDQLDKAADPKAQKRFDTQQRKYWKERKQRYWWRKGKTAPDRAPDMAAAAGR